MKTKIFSALAAGLILTMLVLAGPANAAAWTLDTQKADVNQGSTAIFRAETDSAGELAFSLTGAQALACKFTADGELITAESDEECDAVKIHVTQTENKFGYGYGYGETSTYKYLIQLKTTGFEEGDYTPALTVGSDTETGDSFRIYNPPENPKKEKKSK